MCQGQGCCRTQRIGQIVIKGCGQGIGYLVFKSLFIGQDKGQDIVVFPVYLITQFICKRQIIDKVMGYII